MSMLSLAGFLQVMENLESHGIYDLNFQASWNSSEGQGKSWKSNKLSKKVKRQQDKKLKNNRRVGNRL